jgi:sodium transport system ATP-binding protein
MIEVTALHKRFGSVVAVDEVSFSAQDGAITGLLGPNGAGKTTSLCMLYGLIQPDRGSAMVDGIDVSKRPNAARARLGVLPDARGIYARLSARENVRYYGELYGLTGDDLEQRIDELIEVLDMSEIADRRTEGFSQGERMKVAIARAMVHRPQNIVLDEPTSGLDVMSTRALRRLLRRLRSDGRCVVLSSHVMQEVSALCDRIVMLAHGRIVATGTPDELRALTGIDSLEDVFVKLTLGDRYADDDGEGSLL